VICRLGHAGGTTEKSRSRERTKGAQEKGQKEEPPMRKDELRTGRLHSPGRVEDRGEKPTPQLESTGGKPQKGIGPSPATGNEPCVGSKEEGRVEENTYR